MADVTNSAEFSEAAVSAASISGTAPPSPDTLSFKNQWSPTFLVVTFLIGASGLVTNAFTLLVLLGYRLKQQKRKLLPCHVLLLHQSGVDALYSGMILLTYAVSLALDGRFRGWWGDVLCVVFRSEIALWSMVAVSSYNLAFITTERYLMTAYPVLHRNHATNAVAVVTCVVSWAVGLAFNALYYRYLEVSDGFCLFMYVSELDSFNHLALYICYLIGAFLVPSTLMIFGCIGIAVSLYKRRKIIAVAKDQTKAISISMKNLTVTMILVAASYSICLFPYQITYMVYQLIGESFPSDVHLALFVFSLINCALNPFIYAVKYEAFRLGVRQMFARCGPSNEILPEQVLPGNTDTATTGL